MGDTSPEDNCAHIKAVPQCAKVFVTIDWVSCCWCCCAQEHTARIIQEASWFLRFFLSGFGVFGAELIENVEVKKISYEKFKKKKRTHQLKSWEIKIQNVSERTKWGNTRQQRHHREAGQTAERDDRGCSRTLLLSLDGKHQKLKERYEEPRNRITALTLGWMFDSLNYYYYWWCWCCCPCFSF